MSSNRALGRLLVAVAFSEGLILSVRPELTLLSTIVASVQGAYNAVWVRGTFYYVSPFGHEPSIREALAEMSTHDFLVAPPFAMPMEKSL